MRIVIPDDYQDAVRGLACFSRLHGHEVVIFNDTVKDTAALATRFAEAEVLVLIRERTAIRRELLERLPDLRLIAQTGRGTAHIDVAECQRRGIVVVAGSGSPIAPAELTWGLILAAMRRIPQEAARLRSGRWQGSLGTALYGRALGVWGFGRIGGLVARYGRSFGMKVGVWGRPASLDRAAADGYEVAPTKAALFAHSDVLSLHLRLTPETRGIVSAADLARMKHDALLVNTSRAELIEQGALETALRRGHPGCAAIDVYESEPVLAATHPLLSMDNVICTPHLGYAEKDTYERYFGEAFDQIVAFAAGQPLSSVAPAVC